MRLPSRCLLMNVYSEFIISAFGCHVAASRLCNVDGKMSNKCVAVGGMKLNGGNRNTRRKPILVPLHPPQILHDLIWDLAQAAVV
jgi:hypothetical protein